MKNGIIYIKGLIVAMLFSVIFSLYGCDITDPLEGIKVILDTRERETTVSVIFRDAATNEPIGFSNGETVTITFTGPDSDQFIDLLNRDRSEFESRRGFVSFAIRDGRTPSLNNPIEVVALVSSSSGNFLPTSQRLFISSTGSNAVEIQMVNRQGLPQGVNGGATDALTAVTPDAGTANEVLINRDQLGAQTPLLLSIPEGTRFFNASGTAVSGTLTAEMYHFNHKDQTSLQSFPGGLAGVITNIEDLANSQDFKLSSLQTEDDNVFFTPAGFLSVNLEVDGNRVRTADGEMEFCMGIPEDVFNRSGERVAVGTSVPIWSYDRDLGEWTFEFESVVQQTPANDPDFGDEFPPNYVCGTTNHFSFWAIGDVSPVCRNGAVINLVGLQMPAIGRLVRADVEGDIFMGLYPSQVSDNGDRFISLTKVPSDIPGRLEILDLNGNIITTVNLPQLCDRGPVNVDLREVQETIITFMGTGVCPNRDVQVRPSLPLFIKPDLPSSQWLHVGNTRRGAITLGIPEPGTYMFGIYFENRWYEYNVDLSGFRDGDVHSETIELPDSICRDL